MKMIKKLLAQMSKKRPMTPRIDSVMMVVILAARKGWIWFGSIMVSMFSWFE